MNVWSEKATLDGQTCEIVPLSDEFICGSRSATCLGGIKNLHFAVLYTNFVFVPQNTNLIIEIQSMKNMDFENLVLIKPLCKRGITAYKVVKHGKEVLKKAKIRTFLPPPFAADAFV